MDGSNLAFHTGERSPKTGRQGKRNGYYTIIKGLTAQVMGAARLIDDEESYYINTKATGGVGDAQAGVTNHRRMLLQNTNQLTYQKTIGADHNLSITAVYEQQREEHNDNFAGSKGFNTDALTYNNLGFGNSPYYPYSSRTTKTIQSVMGRVNYAFKDRYLLSFTSRYDGASVFGQDHKWGFFPSVAAAWLVSNEDFFKNIESISNLKLRASYGLTGSQGVAPYTSLDQLNTSSVYAINGSTLSPGVTLLPDANKRMLTAITAEGPGGYEKQDILKQKRTGCTLQGIGALATGTAPFECQPVNFRDNSGGRLRIGR